MRILRLEAAGVEGRSGQIVATTTLYQHHERKTDAHVEMLKTQSLPAQPICQELWAAW
jgi:hypothetical protein